MKVKELCGGRGALRSSGQNPGTLQFSTSSMNSWVLSGNIQRLGPARLFPQEVRVRAGARLTEKQLRESTGEKPP